MSANELKRIKEFEVENAKLKKMYAERALESTAIKGVLSRKLQRQSLSARQWRS
jgi:putative transposase